MIFWHRGRDNTKQLLEYLSSRRPKSIFDVPEVSKMLAVGTSEKISDSINKVFSDVCVDFQWAKETHGIKDEGNHLVVEINVAGYGSEDLEVLEKDGYALVNLKKNDTSRTIKVFRPAGASAIESYDVEHGLLFLYFQKLKAKDSNGSKEVKRGRPE